MPVINRPPGGRDNDKEHYQVLIKGQRKDYKNKSTPQKLCFIPIGSTVEVQQEDRGPWTHGTIVGKHYQKIIRTDPTTFTPQKQVE